MSRKYMAAIAVPAWVPERGVGTVMSDVAVAGCAPPGLARVVAVGAFVGAASGPAPVHASFAAASGAVFVVGLRVAAKPKPARSGSAKATNVLGWNRGLFGRDSVVMAKLGFVHVRLQCRCRPTLNAKHSF